MTRIDYLKEHFRTLAIPGPEQLAYLESQGLANLIDELALDFDAIGSVANGLFADGEINADQLAIVERLNRMLELMSGQSNAELWTPSGLLESAEWESVREVARTAMQLFGGPVNDMSDEPSRVKVNGRSVSRMDYVPLTKSTVVKLTFESVNSPWRQGVYVSGYRDLVLEGDAYPDPVVLWADKAPRVVVMRITPKEQERCWVANVWDTGDGRMRAWHNGGGMIAEVDRDRRRYLCNDGFPDNDFDDLVFTFEVAVVDRLLREKLAWVQINGRGRFYACDKYTPEECRLRMNDFPEEPLWTLLYRDESYDLDERPRRWSIE